MTRSITYSPYAKQQLADLYAWIAGQSGFPERAEAYISAILRYSEGCQVLRVIDEQVID